MRLFVAVNLPESEKLRLKGIVDELKRTTLPYRWVEPTSLHITLKFLGEVAEAKYGSIVAGLHAAAPGISPFDVALGGFGGFPSLVRPRILWLGVEAPPALLQAQEQVERELEPLGFPREDRRFHAHVTLGRLKNQGIPVDSRELDRSTSALGYNAVVRVDSLDLMRSHTGPNGARYERVERAMLANR